MMKFSSFGATINSHEIVNSITLHGIPVFHTSEIHIKPFVCRKSVCNLADIIAVFKSVNRFYIVGIEIKEIGLFDLNSMKVVKEPGYLFPDPDFRAHIMKRIKKHFHVLSDVVDDPFQRTLLEFQK